MSLVRCYSHGQLNKEVQRKDGRMYVPGLIDRTKESTSELPRGRSLDNSIAVVVPAST